AGTYTITEEPEAGWTQLGTKTSYTVVVDAAGNVTGDEPTGIDFYNHQNGELSVDISGHKFEDADGDLGTTGDQTGFVGWKIDISDGTNTVTETTGVNGVWTHHISAPGTYTITEQPEGGWSDLGSR